MVRIYQGYSRHCPETEHHSWLRTGTLDTSQLEQIMSTAEWYKWFRPQSHRERQAWKAEKERGRGTEGRHHEGGSSRARA